MLKKTKQQKQNLKALPLLVIFTFGGFSAACGSQPRKVDSSSFIASQDTTKPFDQLKYAAIYPATDKNASEYDLVLSQKPLNCDRLTGAQYPKGNMNRIGAPIFAIARMNVNTPLVPVTLNLLSTKETFSEMGYAAACTIVLSFREHSLSSGDIEVAEVNFTEAKVTGGFVGYFAVGGMQEKELIKGSFVASLCPKTLADAWTGDRSTCFSAGP